MTRTRRCGPCSRGAQERSHTCDFHGEPQARRAGASPAAASDAGHGLLDLLPVRSMTRTRRCGPLLKGQGHSRTCDFHREPRARRRADASPAAASGAGRGRRDLLPVRSMACTRHCGPLLKKRQGRSGTCDFQREPQARRRADAIPAAASGAGHGLRDLLPVRSMIRARRCGPLLKRAGKGAAAFAISKENRKQGGLVQFQPPLQTQAAACAIYCRCGRSHAHGAAARCSTKGKGAAALAISRGTASTAAG